jgi:hypothetical protein
MRADFAFSVAALASINDSKRLADRSLSFYRSPSQSSSEKQMGLGAILRGLCSFRHHLAFPVDHLGRR